MEMETTLPIVKQKKEKEYDVFKDSWFRYLGYSNEIGEALRKVTSRHFVNFTYFVEFGYFIADTVHKSHRAYTDPNIQDNKSYHVIKSSGYTILWQFLATCLIPPMCINLVVGRTHNFLFKRSYGAKFIKYTPVTIGLLMIPLFNIYVDPVVEHALDYVFDTHLS